MNQLLEILDPKNIIFDFKASTKEDAIRKMISHMVATQTLDAVHEEETVSSLMNREKSMSTGIGSGVAIPHCSVHYVNELKCAMAIAPSGIDFDALDHGLVQIFIMLIVPKNKFQDHIKTLALIAKTLNIPEEREKLIKAKNFEEIQKAFLSKS
ncbi:PTS sugar transporter subunit IIA [Leptospira levettii]|uniref:PTS sugar transporter subunit IIA n=1 Tax=Leptospira levettii TaxID=2023178 RepID=A0ABY2MP19_9LEPT|nr:PTS sugar transporter subunit IIA [Leptospira levettii]PKA23472.1 PTS sugar transporter subunit IIA [Leptospira sp. mixed culture ATI2-C-A1]MCG6146653.1 PTS sugar transporter subunit IIA [Leptospira levettii]MCW7474917.1 PTS sugar transporter subunit IIA [Leptospira levettii]MCW7496885.1 PTS sugar transporter subunit IIA [Leptospira levettii]MCW7506741.1 PTS sugar transporter subunit IIA [Leptospira levettii]